jgi:hypothetical protein
LTDRGLTLCLTPHGRLLPVAAEDTAPLDPARTRRLEEAFERGSGHGLLLLGAAEVGTVLPPVLSSWRELAARFLAAVCTGLGAEAVPGRAPAFVPPPAPGGPELEALAAAAPLMPGAE